MQNQIAHRFWATAPDACRFSSASQALPIVDAERAMRKEVEIDLATCEVFDRADNLYLGTKSGTEIAISHHAFERLSASVGAPADFMRQLPASTAGMVMRDLARNNPATGVKLGLIGLDEGGKPATLEDLASLSYARTWDGPILREITKLEAQGWRTPPARPARPGQRGTRPANEADVIHWANGGSGLSIKVGDMIAPAGIYRTPTECFAFLVKGDPIKGPKGTMVHQFLQILNSPIYERATEARHGVIDFACGNHLLHGEIVEASMRVRHVGRAAEKVVTLIEAANAPVDLGATLMLAEEASRTVIARELKDVVPTIWNKLQGKGWAGAIKKNMLKGAFEIAVKNEERYGAANTLFAIHSGMTEIAQEHANRYQIDIAASRMLTIDV